MEHLSFDDIRNLMSAIQSIYSLSDLSSFGVDLLPIVDRLVPSQLPTFVIADFHSHRAAHITLPGYYSFTPEVEAIANSHWYEHPLVQNMPLPLNTCLKVSDFVTEAELHQLEGFYQQYLRVMGCEDQMNLFLPTIPPQSWDELVQKNSKVLSVTLNHSQRNFTECDRLILNLLRPHLGQAHANVRHFQKLQNNWGHLQQFSNPRGLVTLDIEGKFQFATPQAETLLTTYFGQFSSSQLPITLRLWVTQQIADSANPENLPKARLPLRISQAGKQLVIRLVIQPLEEQILLLLEEQTLSLLNSLKLLGLSQRETEVLFLVIQGKDNKAISKQMSVHPGTVRKHLQSIYCKLGVQSRTEAIAQALEQLGILYFQPLT